MTGAVNGAMAAILGAILRFGLGILGVIFGDLSAVLSSLWLLLTPMTRCMSLLCIVLRESLVSATVPALSCVAAPVD